MSYNVTDAGSNNATTVTRTVEVIAGIPVITLTGDASMTLLQGQTYVEAGATAYDAEDGNISSDVFITIPAGFYNTSINNLTLFSNGVDAAWPKIIELADVGDGASSQNAQTLGINITSLPSGGANYRVYKTVANGNDFFGSATALSVGSQAITVGAVGFDRTVKIQFSSGEVEFNSIAINNVSQDLSNSNIGTYDFLYDVSDSGLNQASTVTRTVEIVADNVAPVITLNGDASTKVVQNGTYTELGAAATDNLDGDISNNVIISGTVNTSTIGTYSLNYDVSDSALNQATTVTRTVEVINPTTTISVTVVTDYYGSNKFYFNGSIAYDLTLIPGQTYIFNQSDSTNINHPLVLYSGSSEYTDANITYTGTAGQSSAQLVVVYNAAMTSPLSFACQVHGLGMGNGAQLTII